MTNIKKEISDFYNQTGWSQVREGYYQNAVYEDFRPVSREYTHRTHLRINRYISSTGKYLLDAGSGPVQYPEYLTYSRNYEYRVCVDISVTALKEARQRISDHGLYVIADVAKLPFKEDVFDGVVSLHTIHHLPVDEHLTAYRELHRVLAPEKTAVIVNGWGRSWFFRLIHTPWRFRNSIRRWWRSVRTRRTPSRKSGPPEITFVDKYNADWLMENIGKEIPLSIYVWRSITSITSRLYVHAWLGGYWFLSLLFWLEERFPVWFGKHGAYPIVVITKE